MNNLKSTKNSDHTTTEISLIKTKLYAPAWRAGMVSRPRLIQQLNQDSLNRVTLICAPAGFGKTTLLAEWLADRQNTEKAAWVSLDNSDNDPSFFWTYFIEALQKQCAGIGAGVLLLLNSPQFTSIESILTTLINEINAVKDDLVIFLDDYHVIENIEIHEACTFLVEHLPANMRLVIASRTEPQLPLARLRARGELIELRSSDLRFTAAEAAHFLNDSMGLQLQEDDVNALETRTEGWIAGLQLAALSMRGRNDIDGFIKSFSGDNRYIADYLVEEVLKNLPEKTRSFLLQTSILERLCGPLCDAVTGQENGKEMLEALERGNLFVIPLDDQRRWYRYHHLFADVLHVNSQDDLSCQPAELHKRASHWFQQNDSMPDAIRHAIRAEDMERVAELIELVAPVMRRGYHEATLIGWFQVIPDELIRCMPVLCVEYGWALLSSGELEAGEIWLKQAEHWLDKTANLGKEAFSEMIVVDEASFQSLPARIASARAFLSQAFGDATGTIKHAQRALELLPEDDHFHRSIPAAILGLAYWANGDLEAAYRYMFEGMESLILDGNIQLAISGTFILAHIRRTQGRLREAVNTYERSLKLTTQQDEIVFPGMAVLHIGLSELLCEQGNLKAAAEHVQKGMNLGKQAIIPGNEHRLYARMATLKEAQGDLDGAMELLNEAERQYKRDPIPDLKPIAALKARIWLQQDRLTDALGWVQERQLSIDADLSYLNEFEYVTYSKVLLADYRHKESEDKIPQITNLLERLLKAAEEGGRTGSVIEILILQALAYQAQGDVSTALEALEKALILSEPEGYIQVFVDKGQAMRDLLRHAVANGIMGNYSRKLLSAIEQSNQLALKQTESASTILDEPLTTREIEILRLIAAGMKNQEIADHLFISLYTVKRHIANTYGKLGVSHRTEAVARARELKLL